jgi:hypothetical protein
LQNSVFFREEFPDHPIFEHVFEHDYAGFADEIRRACAQMEASAALPPSPSPLPLI